MRVKISMLLFVFALCSGTLWAQTKVTGTVTGSDGMPLPGVSVVIKGTTRGVSTDFDGKYELQASANEVLEFSSLGYTSKEWNAYAEYCFEGRDAAAGRSGCNGFGYPA